MTDESCSVSDIFRKEFFDAIKALRKGKKKRPGGKAIHIYVTRHNTTNLDVSFALNAIKLLLEENLRKNIPTNKRRLEAVIRRCSSE